MKLPGYNANKFIFDISAAEMALSWHIHCATRATTAALYRQRELARHYGKRSRYWFIEWIKYTERRAS